MEAPPTVVALALGSNLGPRRRHLEAALAALRGTLDLLRLASLYESAAVGAPGQALQPPFLNSALLASTRLEPEELLAVLKRIEQSRGRRRARRWAPRALDLDLLLYGDRVERRPELQIPHPRLCQRRFVLDPLAEIAPALPVPPTGTLVGELLSRLGDEPAPRAIAAATTDASGWL